MFVSERMDNLAKVLGNYDYFIWKDIESVKRNLDNKANKIELDICIKPSQISSLINKLELSGYNCYYNVIPRYKRNIYHAFFFFNEGYIHLHIYPGLITGNHFSKEYDLPIESKFYDDHYFIHKLKFANKELELYLAAIRVHLKKRSFNFEKIKDSDIENYSRFKELKSKYKENYAVIENNADYFRYKTNIRVSFENCYYKFIFPVETKFFKRSNKKMVNSKKIAIIGTDGSGKSTICSSIYSHLRKKTPIKHVYLGSNFKNFSSRTWLNFLLYKAIFRLFKPQLTHKIYAFGLFNYEYSRLDDSRRQLNKALEMSNDGNFILFERFPIEGFLDFPKSLTTIDTDSLSKRQKNKLAEMSDFWRNSTSEIKVFLITTPLDKIIERRSMPNEELLDIKKKKIFESEFISRGFYGLNVDIIKNDKPLPKVLDEIYAKV